MSIDEIMCIIDIGLTLRGIRSTAISTRSIHKLSRFKGGVPLDVGIFRMVIIKAEIPRTLILEMVASGHNIWLSCLETPVKQGLG